MAALATCYCNDLFREAVRRGITIDYVQVEAEAVFAAEGRPPSDVQYRVELGGDAAATELDVLARHTDSVAEIQNAVRSAVPLVLEQVTVAPWPT